MDGTVTENERERERDRAGLLAQKRCDETAAMTQQR